MAMNILVTDLTVMHNDMFCIAGWCAAESRMVRPLPGGHHWSGELVTRFGVAPGITFTVSPSSLPNSSAFPHRTEDTPVDPTTIRLVDNGPIDWFGPKAPPTSSTLNAAFGGLLTTSSRWNGAVKCHIVEGTRIGSLSAIRLTRSSICLFEDEFEGKKSLRARLNDSEACYDLPVVARNLKEIYRTNGVEAVSKSLPNQGKLHIRVGLARAWQGQPQKCAVMVNGIYW